MSEAVAPVMPYKGLMPYSDSEQDAQFFFGRKQKKEIIVANLIGSRLTLFYGPSGVGKSSVLRAGVAYHLRRKAAENLRGGRHPKLAVVVFDSWRDKDPLAGLAQKIEEAVARLLPGREINPPLSAGDLSRSLLDVTAHDPQNRQRPTVDLLVILDQFEEYFLYHAGEDGEGTFAVEFPRLVNDTRIGVNFLISMRDDSTTKLDRFKGRIPNLLANRLSIEHLDVEAAREAIVKPLWQYNELHRGGQRLVDPERVEEVLALDGAQVGIEPRLVEAILSQVKTGQVVLGHAGGGTLMGGGPLGSAHIETPFLQLVLTRLWEAERAAGSRVLRLGTLEDLGGAERIVRTHLDKVMEALPRAEQDVAANVFYHLVTPSGAKIAHSARDLAFFCKLPPAEVEGVLRTLSGTSDRILRTVAAPGGEGDEQGGTRYEISHDVLASAILDWRTRHEQKLAKELAEAEAEKKLALERAEAERLAAEQKRQLDSARQRAEEQARVARKFRRLFYAFGLMFLVALITTVLAWKFARDSSKLRAEGASLKVEGERYKQEGEAAKALASALAAEGRELQEKAAVAQEKADAAQSSANAATARAEALQRKADLANASARQALATAHAEKVRAAAEKAKADDAKELAQIIVSATAAFRAEESEEALALYQKVIPLYRRNGDVCGEADALLNIGDIYRDLSFNESDPGSDEAIANAKASLTEAVNLYGRCAQSSPGALARRADAYSRLGAIYTMRRENPEEAEKSLSAYENALALYRQAGKEEEARSILETLVSISPPGKAIEYQRELVSAAKEVGDPEGILVALIALGRLYLEEGRRPDALAAFQEAIPFSRQSRFPTYKATVLVNIAQAQAPVNRDEALKTYEQALKIYDPTGSRLSAGAANVYSEMGKLYSEFDKQKAIETYNLALDRYRRLNENAEPQTASYKRYRRKEAETLSSLGELTFNLADPNRSLRYYEQAVAAYEELRDDKSVINTLRAVGKLYEDAGDRTTAAEYYRKAESYKLPAETAPPEEP